MSDDQFSQLEAQISGLEGRMGSLEGRMDGFDTSLARMFTYMEKRFDHLEETKADKADFNRLYDRLDGLIKRIDEDRQERLAVNSQLNRHERWHHQTAGHLGLKLD